MDEAKLDALVLYVCAKCEDPARLGAARLNKVLWYVDVISFAETGKPMTGAVYIKRQFGPVPKELPASLERLAASGALVERQAQNYNYGQTQFIALQKPDISIFTAEQISLVDRVVEMICSVHSTSSFSMLSHDMIWESAEIGEEIPMAAAAFGGNFGEIDETDMAWGRSEIDMIEGVGAGA